jgi:hypothetical protein
VRKLVSKIEALKVKLESKKTKDKLQYDLRQ